jgi:hypothetical protein
VPPAAEDCADWPEPTAWLDPPLGAAAEEVEWGWPEATDGDDTVGTGADGTTDDGRGTFTVGVGIGICGTLSVGRLGVVTEGVEMVGVLPTGVDTDGTVSDGTVRDGTETVVTVRALLMCGCQ